MDVNDLFWKIFEKTGNVGTYLIYKECCADYEGNLDAQGEMIRELAGITEASK